MLEAIENLLERQLHSGQDTAMRSCDSVPAHRSTGKWQDGDARGKQEWEMSDDKAEPEHATRHCADRAKRPTGCYSTPPAGADVGIQSDDGA